MKLELCVASMEAIQLAKQLNVDRIELCQNLEQGGMTPSIGLIEYALESGVETHVLIRPRPGGFIYTKDEIELMLKNISECKKAGVEGVVIGALNNEGMIDQSAIELMINQADGLAITFHRAFDDMSDPVLGMNQLIKLGINRILSSGQSSNIDLGFNQLKKMVEMANERIEIMAGGGVNVSNIRKIRDEIQPSAIHFSGTRKCILDENSLFSESILKADEVKIRSLIEEFQRK